MQRALAVISFSPELLRHLMEDAHQISFFNLGFSYRTMTVLWPGVLRGLCVAYTLLENKRARIEQSLKSMSDDTQHPNMLHLDPFHISPPLFRSKVTKTTASLFAAFPMIAIATHIFMIILWVLSLGWNAVRFSRLKEYLGEDFVGVSTGTVFSLSSTLFAVLGLFGTLVFWRVIKKSFE